MEEDFFIRSVGEMEICVAGLGLIGGSYAKALRKLKPRRIVAYNRSSAVLERAREEAVIDEGFTDARKAVAGADLVILTLYPQCIAPFLENCAGCLKEKALITDAASVKGDLLERVDALIPPGVDFVSGHPMAGREGGGYDSSDGEIFKGSNYILLPRSANLPEHVDFLDAMARAMGCAKVVRVPWQDHDRLIARSSALPHLLAACLVEAVKDYDLEGFIGGSFRDATRVAKINEALWTKLFWDNRQQTHRAIEDFKAQLDRFQEALEDPQRLQALLVQVAQDRERLYR